MKKILAIILFMGMICVMTVASAGESYWTIGYPDLFLRSTPSKEYPYLERIPYGSEVTMITDGADWVLVYYNGQYGYCKREFLNDYDPYYLSEPHPETPEAAFSTNILQRGNKKPTYKVKNLQLCLVEAGYLADDPGVDGYFGRETQDALIQFQQDHDIKATGKAGDITKAVLWDLYQDVLMIQGYAR